VNEEAVAHWGVLRQKKERYILYGTRHPAVHSEGAMRSEGIATHTHYLDTTIFYILKKK
jgi:hypothetical protein